MNTFTLELRSGFGAETIPAVESFVGEDASGSFGLQARAERFMTALRFGLARFRCAGGGWEYLALPGALLYFSEDRLLIATRRYLRGPDYARISSELSQALVREEQDLRATHESLHELESAMLKRLWQMRRRP